MNSRSFLFGSAIAASLAVMLLALSLGAQDAQKPAIKPKPEVPKPGGPQTDGVFRKVILDADREVNGEMQDTVKDPMELAVAPDGRVFWAERAGVVKMWNPSTKSTVTVASIKVFDGLEDGLIGITLDPNFAKNGWVYLNHSLPETTKDEKGRKSGIIRVSRYTLKDEKLDLDSEKKILDVPTQRDE